MVIEAIVCVQREAAEAEDTLTAALAHGDTRQKAAARIRWRSAHHGLARLSRPTR